MPIRCDIISQDRIVFKGDADIVVLPGAAGILGVLPNHAPLLTVLQYGVITVRKNNQEEHFTVAGGVAEVLPEVVSVLADAAENVEEIDIQRAEAAQKRAQQLLATVESKDQDEYLSLQAALRRSNLRLEATQRYNAGRKKKSQNVS